jgi:hypothetical protein
MLFRPALLFENVLDADQFAAMLGDMKANGVSGGGFRKSIAASAPVSQIANLPHARFFGLKSGGARAAFTAIRIAQWKPGWNGPGARFEASHRVKIRAGHCSV